MTTITPDASCCARSCTCTHCTCDNGSCTRSRKLTDAITLRRARPADREALRRLAMLDSAPAPTGETLVAEHDGALVAAVSTDGQSAIADPFLPTAAVVALLRAWSNQVQVAA
jgi:hypothetical protein